MYWRKSFNRFKLQVVELAKRIGTDVNSINNRLNDLEERVKKLEIKE